MRLSWSMQVFLNIYKRVSYILYLPGFSSRRGLEFFCRWIFFLVSPVFFLSYLLCFLFSEVWERGAPGCFFLENC